MFTPHFDNRGAWDSISMNANNYHSRIPGILNDRFVHYDDVAHGLATALASGKNVLLHGAGGHAKSEMVQTALQGLDLWDHTYVESFGEGLTEDNLWGGIDLDAMNKEHGARIQYQPEYSFLNSETAVFEEMLDAPSPVLLGLKDTLTRGELRKGPQRFPMKTRVIIACTNHAPDQYADSDDPADKARLALLERFPIRVEVLWPSYTPSDYLSMFQKHHMWGSMNSETEKLAEILSEATHNGHFVSPRTAIHALEIINANAMDRGHDTVTPGDMADIKCLAGLDRYGEELVEEIGQMALAADARAAMKKYQAAFQRLIDDANANEDSAMKNFQAAKSGQQLLDRFNDVSYVDSIAEERGEFVQLVQTYIQSWTDRGNANVRTNPIELEV